MRKVFPKVGVDYLRRRLFAALMSFQGSFTLRAATVCNGVNSEKTEQRRFLYKAMI